MCSEYSIKVADLSKSYQIYARPKDRLLQMLWRGRKKYYEDFWALKNVSFEMKKGETIGVVGRNGSGKSTLLQLICGTLSPSSGEIYTNGRIAALLELGSGFNPEFTGRENVYLNASVLGLSKEEIDERFGQIVQFADIGNFVERPVKTYSSGMIVRLAFAVQASVDPDILIVDEALAVGDEKFQRKCFARLENLKTRGTSILFVSHAGAQVIELCDRALLLERGENLLIGSPKSVVQNYQRIIYARPEEQVELIANLKGQQEIVGQHDGKSTTPPPEKAKSTAKEHFDPGLIPETVTVYPENGARIKHIEVRSENGEKVNLLLPRSRYKICMSGELLQNLNYFYFGIHIRTISGNVITGQRFPDIAKTLSDGKKGQKFTVEFLFDMKLLPGVYFIGGGVWADNGDQCAHRVQDFIMVRMLKQNPIYSFGNCDLFAADAHFELV